jgi:hypothetical protein
MIWQPVNAITSSSMPDTGTMLWRKNIGEDQTQAATYEVYGNPNAYIDVADSPAPLTPGPIDPDPGTQGAMISGPTGRLSATRARTHSTTTAGSVTVRTIRTATSTRPVSTATALTASMHRSRATACPGAGCRVFTSTWNPPPGNPAPGDEPLDGGPAGCGHPDVLCDEPLSRSEMYQLGFTEQAFNFQQDNFGRGGTGVTVSLRARARTAQERTTQTSRPCRRHAEECRCSLDRADARPRRNDRRRRDHPRSDARPCRTVCTATPRASRPTWPAVWAKAGRTGMHSRCWPNRRTRSTAFTRPADTTHLLITSGFTANYYYGIRRYPKAVMAFTGGPTTLPHNPYASEMNAGCATALHVTECASHVGPISATCDQVHNAGEIWSSALWEVRASDGHSVGL